MGTGSGPCSCSHFIFMGELFMNYFMEEFFDFVGEGCAGSFPTHILAV